jgi:hypothetical protein
MMTPKNSQLFRRSSYAFQYNKNMKTFRYRIKDSNKLSFLRKTAGAVNHVWNLTQNAKLEHLNATSKFLTYKELAKQVKLPGQLNAANDTTRH